MMHRQQMFLYHQQQAAMAAQQQQYGQQYGRQATMATQQHYHQQQYGQQYGRSHSSQLPTPALNSLLSNLNIRSNSEPTRQHQVRLMHDRKDHA